ncbi:hypothetical protein Tsp_07401 [Trichinella spiralis]|nr:hypothetical protein Tsp_07401 [Trichinella spiralis]
MYANRKWYGALVCDKTVVACEPVYSNFYSAVGQTNNAYLTEI